MTDIEIKTLVNQLDTKDMSTQDAAWAKLRPLGVSVVPYLAEVYPHFKKWEGRRCIVYQVMEYARVSEVAFQIGIAALNDRSSIVRYRACCVLAYSLRRDALPMLKGLLTHKDQETAQDARAAIDAIEHQNHHLFMDRDHSGRSFWEVNKGDLPAE